MRWSEERATPELVWVGNGGWVAHDPEVPEGDPRRVIAFIEHAHGRVDVVWVRDRHDVRRFETLRDAVEHVATACRSAQREPAIRREPSLHAI